MKPSNKLITTLAILIATSCLHAQTSASIPVPSQFATAHNIFLAPAGALPLGSNEQQYTALLYAETYKMLQGLGKYQMVSAPADSELTFEISARQQAGLIDSVLRLEVRDTKTHALLWDIDAAVRSWDTSKDEQSVIGKGETQLADQLRSLIKGTLPISAPKKK